MDWKHHWTLPGTVLWNVVFRRVLKLRIGGVQAACMHRTCAMHSNRHFCQVEAANAIPLIASSLRHNDAAVRPVWINKSASHSNFCACMCERRHGCVCVLTRMCACVHVCTRAYELCLCVHARVYSVRVLCVRSFVCSCVRACVRALRACVRVCVLWHVCMCTCVCMCADWLAYAGLLWQSAAVLR